MKGILEDFALEEPEGLWESVYGALPAAFRAGRKRKAVLSVLAAAAACAVLSVLLFRPAASPDGEFAVTVPDGTLSTVAGAFPESEDADPANSGLRASAETGRGKAPSLSGFAASRPAGESGSAAESAHLPESLSDAAFLPDEGILEHIAEDECRADGRADGDIVLSAAEDSPATDAKDRHEGAAISMEEYLVQERAERGRRTGRGFSLAARASGLMPSRANIDSYGVLSGSSLSESLLQYNCASEDLNKFSALVIDNLGMEERTEYSHRQPVRFLVEAEYRINDVLGLSGGLAYTLLVSELQSGAGSSYSTLQKLNYLGIPLRLNAYMLDKGRASLYASAGTMVEKCVSGSTVTDWSVGGMLTEGKRRSIIDRKFQFSLTLSLGAGLRLSDNTGVFLEPGCTWYVPNNGEVNNIYRDKPLNFSLSVGIRTDFSGKGR